MQSIDPLRGEANALSHPPGKYGRKAKTQRNRRELAQAVEHVVQFDTKRGTLPGLEAHMNVPERCAVLQGRVQRRCMVVVSSCLEVFR